MEAPPLASCTTFKDTHMIVEDFTKVEGYMVWKEQHIKKENYPNRELKNIYYIYIYN